MLHRGIRLIAGGHRALVRLELLTASEDVGKLQFDVSCTCRSMVIRSEIEAITNIFGYGSILEATVLVESEDVFAFDQNR